MSLRAILTIKYWDGREVREELGTFANARTLQSGIAWKWRILTEEDYQHKGGVPPWSWWKIEGEPVEDSND
jgi:hypothetical protein